MNPPHVIDVPRGRRWLTLYMTLAITVSHFQTSGIYGRHITMCILSDIGFSSFVSIIPAVGSLVRLPHFTRTVHVPEEVA